MSSKQRSSGKVHFIVFAIVRFLLVVAIITGFVTQRWLIFTVGLIALIVTFIPEILKRFFKIEVPAAFEIMIILFIYGSLFLSEVRGLFAEFWWWDVLLNSFAAAALGLVGFTVMYVLYRDQKLEASPFMVSVFAFCFAVSVGALWEIFEFGMDYFLGFNIQKSGLTDTIGDMAVNAVGALIISAVGFTVLREGRSNLFSSFIVTLLEKNPRLFRSKPTLERSSDEIRRLIQRGEGEKVEFKATLRTNEHTGQFDKRMEHAVLKTIVAYLNSNGGTLLVGVSDKGSVCGLEKDGFATNDKLNLFVTNLIKQHIGSQYLPFIRYELFPFDDKHVLKIECNKSDREVFLKQGKEEEFFVRNGASSAKLEGRALIEYVNHKFKK